jgi:hypothetical protein
MEGGMSLIRELTPNDKAPDVIQSISPGIPVEQDKTI